MDSLKDKVNKIRFEDKMRIFRKYLYSCRNKRQKTKKVLKELDFELINQSKLEKNNFLEALIDFNNPSLTLKKVETFKNFLTNNLDSFEDNIIIFSDKDFLINFFDEIDSRIFLYLEIVEKISYVFYLYMSFFMESEYFKDFFPKILKFLKKLMGFKSFEIIKNYFLIFIILWDKDEKEFCGFFLKFFDFQNFKSIFENLYKSNYGDLEIIFDFFCILTVSLIENKKISTKKKKLKKNIEDKKMQIDNEENKKLKKKIKSNRLNSLINLYFFFLYLDIDDKNRKIIFDYIIQIIKSNSNFLNIFIDKPKILSYILKIAKHNKSVQLVENIFWILSNTLAIIKKDINKKYLEKIKTEVIEISIKRLNENSQIKKSRIWLCLANLLGHSKIKIDKTIAYKIITLISQQIKINNNKEALCNLLFAYNNFMSKLKLNLQFQIISLYIEVLKDISKIIYVNKDKLILLYALKILNCYLEIDCILYNKTGSFFVKDFLEDNELHFCLEEAQKHSNNSVYVLSGILIDKYFNEDEDL